MKTLYTIAGILIIFMALTLASATTTFDIFTIEPTISTIGHTTKEGYDYTAGNSLFNVYFKNNTNTANPIRFEKQGYFFTYDISQGQILWRGQAGQPQASTTLGGGYSSNTLDTVISVKLKTCVVDVSVVFCNELILSMPNE